MPKKISVAILGSTGYVGLELVKILSKHPSVEIVFIGTEKGNTMETRIKHNFGMAKPEGYRKSQRLVSLAEKFNLPIISFVDTAGAFPGKDAEERGQSESIASSIPMLLSAPLSDPVIIPIVSQLSHSNSG